MYSIHIDMLNRAAAVPGTGNDLVSFSYSFDIARFVEAALGLDHWEESMQCYSDVRTYNDVVKIAEKQTGASISLQVLTLAKVAN